MRQWGVGSTTDGWDGMGLLGSIGGGWGRSRQSHNRRNGMDDPMTNDRPTRPPFDRRPSHPQLPRPSPNEKKLFGEAQSNLSCGPKATGLVERNRREEPQKNMDHAQRSTARFPTKETDDRRYDVDSRDDGDEPNAGTSETESEQELQPSDGGQAALARAFAKVVQRKDQGKFADLNAYTETIKSRRKEQDVELVEEEAERTRKKNERLELRKRGRIYPKKAGVEPMVDQMERKLRKIATRGVVTLFNAVAKAQKAAEDNKNKTHSAAALTKAAFLAEIKGGISNDTEPKIERNETSKGGWDVLQDGYQNLGNGKLKDLEKVDEEDVLEELDNGLSDTTSEGSESDGITDQSVGMSDEMESNKSEIEADYESG